MFKSSWKSFIGRNKDVCMLFFESKLMECHNPVKITGPVLLVGPFTLTLEYSMHPRIYHHQVISQIYEIYYNKSIDWKICKTTIARIRLKIQSLSHQTNNLLSPDFATIIRYQDLLPGLIPSSSTLPWVSQVWLSW